METAVSGQTEDRVTGAIESQTSKIPSSVFLAMAVGSMVGSLILKLAEKDGVGLICWAVGRAVSDHGQLQQDGEAAWVGRAPALGGLEEMLPWAGTCRVPVFSTYRSHPLTLGSGGKFFPFRSFLADEIPGPASEFKDLGAWHADCYLGRYRGEFMTIKMRNRDLAGGLLLAVAGLLLAPLLYAGNQVMGEIIFEGKSKVDKTSACGSTDNTWDTSKS